MSVGRTLAVLALIAMGMAPPVVVERPAERRHLQRTRNRHQRHQYVARLQARARRRSR